MRRDLLLGALIAVVLHLSVAVHSYLFKNPAPLGEPVATLGPIVAKLLPVIPLEVIDDPQPDDPINKTPPPPVLPDRPQPATDKDFTITLDPPRPFDTRPVFAGSTIPTNSGMGSGFVRGPYRPDEVDHAPQAVLQGPAVYPATMKTQRVTGEVVVRFVVDASNNVRDVRVMSSTQREFESAAVQAVQKWKFKAGTKGGRAVPVQLEVPIRFNLK